VVRQSSESGILYNATQVREQINERNFTQPVFTTSSFSDIKRLQGDELIDALNRSYNTVGIENTIVLTRSNRQAAIYNRGIRAQVLQKEDEISAGDLLMVVKNNYFWAKDYDGLEFIANGDIVEISRIRRYHNLYDLRFADVSLRFLDYDFELDVRILLDSLHAETPADMESLNKKLFENVSEDYAHIGNRHERMKLMRENDYFNALQMKFAYAVTCHKAQGGQWENVFIEQGRITQEQLTPDYFHWLYTALTRATERIFLINFPKELFI
jgi:exodeoxyribonuclease-5